MDTLLRVATPVRADRAETVEKGKHYAAVTFDDGFENVTDNAVPELEKRRIPATLFLSATRWGSTQSGSPAPITRGVLSVSLDRSSPSRFDYLLVHTIVNLALH
jgi:Polysaccharide deacetylase